MSWPELERSHAESYIRFDFSVKIKMQGKAIITAALAISMAMVPLAATTAHAHSGGTNSDGCHENKKSGDYHCHSKN
jgi:uncharacterized membrane protein